MTISRHRIILPLLAALLVSAPAAAENGLSGSVELGFSASGGNTEKLDLMNRNRIAWVDDHSTFAASSSVRYGEVKGTKNTQEILGTFNYDYYPWTHWSLFSFASVLNNRFRDIDIRAIGSVGGKWAPFIGSRGEAALSLAAIREYDRYESDGSQEREFRWSWRTKGVLNLPDKGKLTHTTFVVQGFEKPFDDYRIDSDTSLILPISGWTLLKTTFELNYENRPRPGVERTDRVISTTLLLNWK